MKGGLRPERVSLKDGRYRRAIGFDAEYGATCALCGSPKSRQALRCKRCYHASRITTGINVRGVAGPSGRFRSESRLPAVRGRAGMGGEMLKPEPARLAMNRPGGRAPAARTDRPVSHAANLVDGEQVVTLPHPDRTDLDGVQHWVEDGCP